MKLIFSYFNIVNSFDLSCKLNFEALQNQWTRDVKLLETGAPGGSAGDPGRGAERWYPSQFLKSQ